MRWTPGGVSRNVEDRRGAGGFGGFGGGGMRIGGGAGLILLVLSLLFGRNLLPGDGGGGVGVDTGMDPTSTQPGAGAPVSSTPEEEQMVQFVSFVLDDAQATWTRIFREEGQTYPEAKLVLFRDAVQSACGFAQAATGPFYCPGDQKVYIDLGFYDELDRRLGARGDFAQAYVLAHEIGHHIQRVTGTEPRVREAMERNPGQANEYSVRLELQADCLAGIWANSTAQRQLLEQGDVEEGLGAAAAVGDDRLQQMSGRGVSPESFTHGTSAQRVGWFRRGLESGRVEACDTFSQDIG